MAKLSPTRLPTSPRQNIVLGNERLSMHKINASSSTSLGLGNSESRKMKGGSYKQYSPVVLIPSKEKAKREEYDMKYPWPVDEVRDEYVASLKRSLKCTINPNLYEAMFAPKNLVKHLECVAAIKSSLIKEYDEILTILDLLLKWAALRLLDNSPGLMKCIIEFISELAQTLLINSYTLSTPECAIILPILVDRLSCTNSYIRDLCKQIITLCQKLSPPNVMALQLLKVLRSKNSKAKVECVEILKTMVTQMQTVNFILDRDMNFIATLIMSKDNMIKAAITELLGQGFAVDGDLCWSKIGQIEDAVAKEIKEKVKPPKPERKLSEDTIEAPQDTVPVPTMLNEKQNVIHSKTFEASHSQGTNKSFESFTAECNANRNSGNIFKTEPIDGVKDTVQSIVKQLKFSCDIDHVELTKNVISLLSKETSQTNLESIVYHFANYTLLSSIRDCELMSNFIYEVLKKIEHCFNSDTTIKLYAYLQLVLCLGHPTTMALALFRIAQKTITSNVALIRKCFDIIYKKIKEMELVVVFKELSKIVKPVMIALYSLCNQFVKECVNIYGIDIWNYLKETEPNNELQTWIDNFIFDDIPEFAQIIKGIKTTGVKGLSTKLKEFSQLHPGFNFDIAFSRCSTILMQQIKEELTSPQETKDPKSSIEKFREKYNNSSPTKHTTTEEASVESRLKELSDEITKLKMNGVL